MMMVTMMFYYPQRSGIAGDIAVVVWLANAVAARWMQRDGCENVLLLLLLLLWLMLMLILHCQINAVAVAVAVAILLFSSSS